MPKIQGETGGKSNDSLIFLRPGSIIKIIFLTATAVVLAYIAGVMSGRHLFEEHQIAIEIEKQPTEEKEQDKILAPEELNYARILRDQDIKPRVAGQKEDKNQENSGPINEPDSEAVQPDENLYDYTFQIAAFRDEYTADALRQKLEGLGYRTLLQKTGKNLVILVRMRGSDSRVSELRNLANDLRLGAPLLKEKKPAPSR